MKLKDKIIKNRVGILIFIGVLLVVTIIIGISYAYFFNIEIKNNNTISGNINTKYYTFESSGNSILSLTINQSDLDMANASNDYSSFVSGNGGNINVSLNTNGLKKVYCSYDLVYIPSTAYTSNSGATNAGLKEFTLSGTSDKGKSFSEIDVSGSSTVTLISGVKISTNTNILEKWSFTAKYYNLDVIQDNVVGKTFKGNIKVANTNCSFNEQILGGDYVLLKSTGASSVAEAKSQIESKPAPDFSTATTANDKDIFSAPDDLGTSYYFRGAVDNNWVKYGKYTKDMYNCNKGTISATDTGNSCTKIASSGDDIYWRIIRINGDGSIRMIYSGVTPPTESTKVIKTEDTSLGNSPFNANRDKAEYVGYMYTVGEQHGTSQSSDIKKFLDNWYANYTNLNATGTKITDQIYCNDRTASTSDVVYSTTNYTTLTSWNSTGTTYYYGAHGRITKYNNPILTCAVDSDRFTVNKINSKGNSSLTYPIGLITIDEVEMAGNNWSKGNMSYYLHSGANDPYWSGSPGEFSDSDSSVYVLDPAFGLPSVSVNASLYEVRGVISLSSEAKLIGDGTWNNVYEVEKKGYETILTNNGGEEVIKAKGSPDFSTIATTNEGLYATEDDFGTTYYFRGAVDNNWVKFGKDSSNNDIYWRIIRINGDGSIRMIYSGTTAPTESTKVVMTGTGTQIGTSAFNSMNGKAEYVGYKYTLGEQHGTSTDSTIKTAIDNWYKTTTLETDSATKSLVADQIFCNDRTASISDVSYSTTNYTTLTSWNSTETDYYYGANGRIVNDNNPMLTCAVDSDRFTVNKINSKGNSTLKYPVGLITVDEVVLAGGVYNTANSSYYLKTDNYYWFVSPDHFSGSRAGVFNLNNRGNLLSKSVESNLGVRPVVSLSSKAKLSGNGTYSKPYTVS